MKENDWSMGKVDFPAELLSANSSACGWATTKTVYVYALQQYNGKKQLFQLNHWNYTQTIFFFFLICTKVPEHVCIRWILDNLLSTGKKNLYFFFFKLHSLVSYTHSFEFTACALISLDTQAVVAKRK